MDTAKAKQDLICAEAAEWFTRLQEPDLTADERLRFADWLRSSPQHVAEYLGVAEIWGGSREVLSWCLPAAQLIDESRAEEGNIVSLQTSGSAQDFSHTPGVRAARMRRKWQVSRWTIAASIATLVLGMTFWAATSHTPAQRYSTGPAERLAISLDDGSTVHLDTNSDVRIQFANRARTIELRRGEGRFQVAQDPTRPFVVVTDRVTVKALGTVFDVYRRNEDTRVTVVEGKVQVKAEGPAQTVAAAEEVMVSPKGLLAKRVARDVKQVLPWTQRRFSFRSQHLSQVIGEFNRYNAPAIVVEDPRLADLEVSGAFQVDDPQSLLSYLQKHEAVEVTRQREGRIILSRQEGK